MYLLGYKLKDLTMVSSDRPGLSRLLNPRSVAVVGASRTAEKYGHLIPRCLLDGGFEGEVYLVNPREGEALGRRFHPTLGSIGHRVDLVVSVLPPSKTILVVEDCIAAQAGGVVLLASGFAEAGGHGVSAQNTLSYMAREGGVRLVGPNCLGLFNATARLNVMANDDIPAGSIALITQSGGFAEMFFHEAKRSGGGLSLCVSVGNQADVALEEVIEYAASDPATTVIAVYVEGAADGRAFIASVRAAVRVKPVVVLKGGRGKAGSRATISHTASLAGRADVYDALLREAGAVIVDGLSDFYPVVLTLALAPALRGARIALVGGGGGQGTVMADAMERLGLSVPSLPRELQQKLLEVLWERSSLSNPVEFAGASERSYSVYEKCAELLLESDGIDGVALFGSFGGFRPELETEEGNYSKSARAFADLSQRTGKPLLVQTYFAGAELPAFAVLREEGIPCFASPEVVAKGFAALALASGVLDQSDITPSAIVSAQDTTANLLSFDTASALFRSKQLNMLPMYPAISFREALTAATHIGFPVVVKLLTPSVAHKSDEGLVAINITNQSTLETAVKRILSSKTALTVASPVLGVAAMVQTGIEALVGAVRDPTFGALVMVGSGGIYLEIYRDVALSLAGLSHEDALRLIKLTKLHHILTGARGGPPLDIEALANVITAVSEIMLEHPEITEIDLNPVFVQENGTSIADVRVMASPEGSDLDLERI